MNSASSFLTKYYFLTYEKYMISMWSLGTCKEGTIISIEILVFNQKQFNDRHKLSVINQVF